MASKSPKKTTPKTAAKAPKKLLKGAAGLPQPQASANGGGGYPSGPRWESVTQSNGRQILYMGANVDARRDLRARNRNTMVKKSKKYFGGRFDEARCRLACQARASGPVRIQPLGKVE